MCDSKKTDFKFFENTLGSIILNHKTIKDKPFHNPPKVKFLLNFICQTSNYLLLNQHQSIYMKNACLSIIYILFIIVPVNILNAQLNNPKKIPFQWKTDTSKSSIPLSEITVALPRHSFPEIDYPKFINKDKALEVFFKYEPVISVEINAKAKAYPLAMLTMHEISNDSLSGIPILPTFCPLCNSSIVYDRRLNFKGKNYLLEFEVSGMLRNSDMVMADKQTETWWQQLMGTALVGELSGAELEIIPSMVISVEDFFERYPEGQILSPATGTEAEGSYANNPYEHYDNEGKKPWDHYFDNSSLDDRLPAMERIIDVKFEGGYKIYPFSALAEKKVINDEKDDKNIVIFYDEKTISVLDEKNISDSRPIGSATVFSPLINGKVLLFSNKNGRIIDTGTQSIWDITGQCISGKLKGNKLETEKHGNHFAFAWLKFYPDSEIYGQ
jgi:hypothetical protein